MRRENFLWAAAKVGLISGVVGIYLCLVGMVEVFSKRDFIEGMLTLGRFLLLATGFSAGYIAATRAPLSGRSSPVIYLLSGLVAGSLTGLLLVLLVLLGSRVDLRSVFLNANPALYALLTFEKGVSGAWQLPLLGAAAGALGAAFLLIPIKFRRPISHAILFLILMALFSGLFRVVMINQKGAWETTAKDLFGQTGMTVNGALIFFFAVMAISYFWSTRGQQVQTRLAALPRTGQIILRVLAFLLIAYVVLGLPLVSGPFIAQVIVIVSLYILMGLGLNITLGFAGLLDLGFVAFFAIGAYTVGLLTSYGPFGLQHIPFWIAVPIAVLVSMLFGAFLGLPVLGVRGDYLAIATLGFGEIVRLLAGSDFLSPWFGGPRGIIGIQKPCLGTLGPYLGTDIPRICSGFELNKPEHIYYIAVASALLVAFLSWRLQESRLGRAWMAIREDEDVAQALGVNLIQTKLLAYILGAAFAGFGGAIFTVLIGSIFATSMQLTVSLNVVALIVVGGLGSIPGVVVGAIALIGLPELLREVSEFRILFYGMALILMMLSKPEGLWPSTVTKRELHHEEPGPEIANL